MQSVLTKQDRIDFKREVLDIQQELYDLGYENFPGDLVSKESPYTHHEDHNPWIVKIHNTYHGRNFDIDSLNVLKIVLKKLRNESY